MLKQPMSWLYSKVFNGSDDAEHVCRPKTSQQIVASLPDEQFVFVDLVKVCQLYYSLISLQCFSRVTIIRSHTLCYWYMYFLPITAVCFGCILQLLWFLVFPEPFQQVWIQLLSININCVTRDTWRRMLKCQFRGRSLTVGSSGKMIMFFVDCVMHITLRLSVAVWAPYSIKRCWSVNTRVSNAGLREPKYPGNLNILQSQ